MKNHDVTDPSPRLSPAQVFARPTAENLWLGPAQRAALSQLSAATPVRVLLGPRASGRSTLMSYLANRHAKTGIAIAASARKLRPGGLVTSLLAATGIGAEGLGSEESKRILGVFIREKLARGTAVSIHLDDADRLGQAQFSELLALVSATSSGASGPQLFVSGEHLEPGSSPMADFVRDQVAPALAVLAWLKQEEVYQYLHWRLDRFDLQDAITADGCRLIARWSRGCFASVDYITQLALLLLRNRNDDRIDVAVVRDALNLTKRQRSGCSRQSDPPEDAVLLVSLEGQLLRKVRTSNRLLIGRNPVNDICLDHAALSRHHAVVIHDKSGLICNDLNSANGVYLNGQRILSSPLHDGDILEVGPYRIKIKRPNMATALREQKDIDTGDETMAMPVPGSAKPARLKVIQ